MSLLRTIARPLIASHFLVTGLAWARHSEQTAQQLEAPLGPVADAIPSVDQHQLARALGWAQVGAGAVFALGIMPRLAASVLTLTATLSTLADYNGAPAHTAQERSSRRSQLIKNLSLTGAALLASADTAGKPSLGWRAEHRAQAGRNVGRKQLAQARHASRRAARQAGHQVAEMVNP